MSRRPTPTNPLLLLPLDREPLPEDIREALVPNRALVLSADECAVMRAIARLDAQGAGTVAAREVARECGWPIGSRLVTRLLALRCYGLITYRDRAPRSIRLTDAGWHEIGLLTPVERVWRDGYATGRAAVVAELHASLTNAATFYPNGRPVAIPA